MNIEVFSDSGSVAQRAAGIIAEEAWDAIAARGLFVMAVSGGHTPWLMLRELAANRGIPAGRVSSGRALLLADSAAAGQHTSKTGGVICV